MSYPEPKVAITKITKIEKQEKLITLTDAQGYLVEIEKFAGSCWSIEVRLDLMSQSISRQEYTGDQNNLSREALQLDGQKIIAGQNSLIFNLNTFSFQLYQGSQLVFDAGSKPFIFHQQPVICYRSLMSLKVTDFSKRSPSGPEAKTYQTQMCTFQCPRPVGTVLGLPGTPGQINRNGYRFQLYNTDQFTHTPNSTLYQSWPILFYRNPEGSSWIALFYDNPSETYVDIGDFCDNKLSFESVTNNIRLYVTSGDSIEEVSRQIVKLIGKPELLPLWSFGYQQCRWSYMSTAEIRSVAKNFRTKNVPCDAIYFDIDYMEKFKVFTNDQEKFCDLKECLRDLKDDDFKSIAIIDPGVKIEAGYHVYDTLKQNKNYLTHADGKEFEIVCWPGKAILPDFFTSVTRDLWSDLQKKWMESFEFDGVWNDMNEPSNFDGMNESTIKAYSATGSVRNKFNLYGYYMAEASRLGMLKKNPNERPFVISRSGYPGVQKNAVIWHGDNHAWWEHLRLAIDTCLNYSLCGAYYTGSDVPGFSENPPDDLAIRFFQLGAFLPFFRGHSIYFAKDKEPYAFSEYANKKIRNAILLRYSLIREWYTGFYLSVKNLQPLMMPVFDRGMIVRDHFLLFNKLLVCPVIERDQRNKCIYLPAGNWYRLGDTKNILSGPGYFSQAVDLDSIPVFVKSGNILFKNIPGRNTYESIKDESFEIYPDSDGSASAYWYNDDFNSIEPNPELRYYSYLDGKLTNDLA